MGKSRRLERIIGFLPLFDERNKSRYIPYCDYPSHPGYIKYPKKCEIRNKGRGCNNYFKLYLDDECILNGNPGQSSRYSNHKPYINKRYDEHKHRSMKC
jgi:hypothetical protein